MSEVYQWNPTDASNVDPAKSGTPEGMARSSVNNREREHMGALRRWYGAPEWLRLYRDTFGDALVVSKIDATHYRVIGANMTAVSVAGRRVRMTGATTVKARIVSSVFAAGNTDVEVTGGVVPASLVEVELFFATELGALAFLDTVASGFYVPASADAAGIQAAIDAASAAGGGIVLLAAPAYAIATAIDVKSDVVVFAAGPSGSVCTIAGALNAEPFTMRSRSGLSGFTINAAAQAFGTRDTIRVAAGVSEVLLEKLRLESPDRDGIAALDSNQKVRIAGCQIITPGRDGVRIEDPDGDAKENAITDVVVTDPARTTNGGRGFLLAGRFDAGNLHVELTRAAPAAQVGIELTTKDASGLTHAHTATVRGFTIIGASEDATGLWLGGRGCIAADGAIHLPGNTSRGIRVDSQGAGQVADHNLVANVAIEAADLAVLVQADAYDNSFLGLRTRASQTTDVEERGRRNSFIGCVFEGSAAAGVVVFASSEDAAFRACDFANVVGTAIELQVGATRPSVQGGRFRNNGTNLVDACVTSEVAGNFGSLLTLSPLSDAAAITLGPEQQRIVHYFQSGNIAFLNQVAANYNATMLRRMQAPVNANGARQFRVDWNAAVAVTGSSTITSVNLRMGPLGTIADPSVGTGLSGTRLLTPAIGDLFSLTITWNVGSGANSITITGDVSSSRFTLGTWLRIEPLDGTTYG